MTTAVTVQSHLPTRVSVSRNVLLSAADLSGFQLQVIMHCLGLLRDRQYIQAPQSGDRDITVRLAFRDISARHGDTRNELLAQVEMLRTMRIAYTVDTEGFRRATVVTGLIDSYVVHAGYVDAHISRMAIPWLLNLAVGYSDICLEAFGRLTNAPMMRLALVVASKTTKGAHGAFEISVDDLRRQLGVAGSTPANKLNDRYIQPFCVASSLGRNEVKATLVKAQSTGMGAPSVVAVRFSVTADATKDRDTLIQGLQTCYDQWRPNMTNLRPINDVLTQIVREGGSAFMAAKMEQCRQACTTNAHFANAIAKMLKEQMRIDIRGA